MDTSAPDKIRPVINESLVKPLQRWAVAHSLSLTAAVNFLLTERLKQEKYIK